MYNPRPMFRYRSLSRPVAVWLRSAVSAFVLFLAAPSAYAESSPAPSLVIDSPLDYQVFQRQTKEKGTFLIRGHIADGCPWIEARLTGHSSFGTFSDQWKRLHLDCETHGFHEEWSVPSGGFYELEVRAVNSGNTLSETKVPHVGVGEVFVIAGQSNSTNYGEVCQQTKSGMVVSFSGESWRIANDPQPGVQDHSTKGSFIPSFGDALYDKYRVPIAVASVGHGSTSVRQWLPKRERIDVPPTKPIFVAFSGSGLICTGELFDGLMTRIRQLGPGGFRALLWHQGESDSNQQPEHQITGEDYRRLLEHIIRESKREAGWNFPWFVAQATYSPKSPSSPPIHEAQASLWKSGIALEGPDTDTLTGEYRQNNGTGVHFSEKGLQAHGRLWAEKVGAYLDSILK